MKNFKTDLDTVDRNSTEVLALVQCLGIQTQAGKHFLRAALANALLMDRKQLDYGSRNISGFGTFGVTVRMNDKMERLKSLYSKGKRRKAVNENIQDTFRDISNYAIIALLTENNLWPNE